MISPVTLILGLGQTVGSACAHYFHDQGHNVIIVDQNAKNLARLSDEASDQITTHMGDITSLIGIKNAIVAARESHGRLDNLVSIPSLPAPEGLGASDLEKLKSMCFRAAEGAMISLGLFRDVLMDQDPFPYGGNTRIKQKGSVTFILGLASRQSMPGEFSESVSQGAVEAVARAGALELAEENIRVNAISALRPRVEEKEAWLKSRTPLARTALAEEIAATAYFLSSPSAAIITGQTLVLDGGRFQLSGLLGQT